MRRACLAVSLVTACGGGPSGDDDDNPGVESLIDDANGWRTIVSQTSGIDLQNSFARGQVMYAQPDRLVVLHCTGLLGSTGALSCPWFAIDLDGTNLRQLHDGPFFSRLDKPQERVPGDKDDLVYRKEGDDDAFYFVHKDAFDLRVTKAVNAAGINGPLGEAAIVYRDALGPGHYDPSNGGTPSQGYNPGISLRFAVSPDAERWIGFDKGTTLDDELGFWVSEARATGTSQQMYGTRGLGSGNAPALPVSVAAHFFGGEWLLFALHHEVVNNGAGATKFSMLRMTETPHPGALSAFMDLSPLNLITIESTVDVAFTMGTARLYVREDGDVLRLFALHDDAVSRWDVTPATGAIAVGFLDLPLPTASDFKQKAMTRFGTDGSVIHGFYLGDVETPENHVFVADPNGTWTDIFDPTVLREPLAALEDVELLGDQPMMILQRRNDTMSGFNTVGTDYRMTVAIKDR